VSKSLFNAGGAYSYHCASTKKKISFLSSVSLENEKVRLSLFMQWRRRGIEV